MPITIKTDSNERDWEISLNDQEVVHMFDVEGSETHDPIECVEVNIGGAFVYIKSGDVFTFELL